MTFKNHLRHTVQLSIPLIIGQVGNVLVMVADNIMVGRLGTIELAAISLGVAVFSIFFVVGLGISFGLPPLAAEAHGKGDEREVASGLVNSLLINGIYAIVVIALLEVAMPLMYYLGQEAEVVDLAIPYLRISMWSMLPFMLFQALRSTSDGIGRTRIGMIALIVGNALNIGLNYLLIFGHFGFPSMGVSGAAMSSLIARLAMLLVWLLVVIPDKQLFAIMRLLSGNLLDPLMRKKLLELGIVTSLQMLFEVSIFSGSTLFMGWIGEATQAAHQIALNIITLTFMVTTGFSISATIRVGQFLGSSKQSELQKAGFSSIGLSAAFMCLSAIGLYGLRYWLPTLYIEESGVIEIAAGLLFFAAIFQIPDGIQVSAIGALRGLQDVRIPALFTFIAYIVVGLPVAYILGFVFEMGAGGIWSGLVIGLSLSALMNTIRFYQQSIQLKPS